MLRWHGGDQQAMADLVQQEAPFLEAVVRAEQENPDDGAAALQDIEEALQASLGRKRSR